ncbi:MAG: hypothetical protein GY814_15640 [Gammaproteobacteria bacterium]|nr:hypothetical protein [Gammaproteobacteria bacterium]
MTKIDAFFDGLVQPRILGFGFLRRSASMPVSDSMILYIIDSTLFLVPLRYPSGHYVCIGKTLAAG